MKPFRCNYFLTYRCNSTCEFCRIWRDPSLDKANESSLEEIQKNLEGLQRLGVSVIDFTGGEPLMRADLPEILKASADLGFHNTLTTNCILFPEAAKDIVPYVDTLFFSLDAPFDEEHDRIRGTACYDRVMESIAAAKKLGKDPVLNFTVTRDTVAYLPEMADLAEHWGALLWINPVNDFEGVQGFAKESIDHIKYMLRRKNVAANLAALELTASGGNNIANPRCRALNSVATISPQGELLLPCFYLKEKKLKIDGVLDKVYHSAEVKREAAAQGKFVKCAGCMAWDYLLPSMNYKIDRYCVLNMYSLFLETRKKRALDRAA